MSDPNSGALVVANSQFSSAVAVVATKRQMFAAKAREARRVHIANLPVGVTHDVVKSVFRAKCQILRRQMIESEIGKPLPPGVIVDVDDVVDVSLNNIRPGATGPPFAFVEMSTDDMATRLVTDVTPYEFPDPSNGFQTVMLVNSRARRPANYVPMHGTDPRKIVVLGLPRPEELGEFRQVLELFGPIEQFGVIPQSGFYVEYQDPAAAAAAIKELHGSTDIGDRAIVVKLASEAMRAWLLSRGLPVTGIDDDTAAENSIFASDPVRDVLGEIYGFQTSLTQVLASFAQTQPHLRSVWPIMRPTRILVLMNLFDPEDVTGPSNERDAAELREEIEDEVEKYGRVRNFFMATERPRPPTRAQVKKTAAEKSGAAAAAAPSSSSSSALTVRRDREQQEYGNTNNNNVHDDVNDENDENEDEDKEFERMMLEWYERRQHPVHGDNAVGKVFIEYETVEEAERAQRAIAGRLFCGRTVITSYLYEDVLYPSEAPDDGDDDHRDGGYGNDNNNKRKGPAEQSAATSKLQDDDNDGAEAAGAVEDLD